jgi:hypothetical protein
MRREKAADAMAEFIENQSWGSFEADRLLRSAVVHQLTVIGKAVAPRRRASITKPVAIPNPGDLAPPGHTIPPPYLNPRAAAISSQSNTSKTAGFRGPRATIKMQGRHVLSNR